MRLSPKLSSAAPKPNRPSKRSSNHLKQALGRGQRIELRRFGVFSVKPRKTGIGRNPRTGEEVNIPPGKAVRFKPGKELQGIEDTKKP